MNTNNNIILHCGGNSATLEEIQATPTPSPTRSHVPIPHTELITAVQKSLRGGGYEILQQTHALAEEGQRYFGVMQIANGGGRQSDYGWTIGLRNSHDKTFTAGIAAGTRVFVCDNLAFSGEIKVARKHTRYIRRDLQGLVQSSIGRMHDALGLMDKRIDAYKERQVSDAVAHDLVIRATDARAIVPRDIPQVLQEWRKPTHEEFAPRSAWSLFNAVTEAHKRISQAGTLLTRGNSLHGVFDSFVGLAKN
jgi:hypothetical protein